MSEETLAPAPVSAVFEMSTTITKVTTALVAAKKAFGPAIKKKENPAFKGSKYLDLAGAIDATEEALTANGLVVMQPPSTIVDSKTVAVTTVLIHVSGEWFKCSLELPAINRGNFDPQSVASAVTYGRRIGYTSLLGIAAEDDDGNAASGRGQQAQPEGMDPEMLQESLDILSQAGSMDSLKEYFGTMFRMAGAKKDKAAQKQLTEAYDARKKELTSEAS